MSEPILRRMFRLRRPSSEAILRRHAVVLDRVATYAGVVRYQARADDGQLLFNVDFERARWAEMGEPAQVTVTIEPGDTLNRDDAG